LQPPRDRLVAPYELSYGAPWDEMVPRGGIAIDTVTHFSRTLTYPLYGDALSSCADYLTDSSRQRRGGNGNLERHTRWAGASAVATAHESDGAAEAVYAETDSLADTGGNTHRVANTPTVAHAGADTDSDANVNGDANANADTDTDTHADTHAYGRTHTDAHGRTHTDAHATTHTHANTTTHTDAHPDAHPDAPTAAANRFLQGIRQPHSRPGREPLHRPGGQRRIRALFGRRPAELRSGQL
jgi:hypothetical protein